MPKTAVSLTLTDQDARTLRRWTRSTSVRSGLVQRARIVLLAADGKTNAEIAATVGCSRPAVVRWRSRYAIHGLDGLVDHPRSGRPRTIGDDRRAEIVPRPWPVLPSASTSPTGRPAPSPPTWGSAA
jgi:Winged helix-turn helix